jgi:hypothetical protein
LASIHQILFEIVNLQHVSATGRKIQGIIFCGSRAKTEFGLSHKGNKKLARKSGRTNLWVAMGENQV